jgi:hypothetical protein
MSDGIKRWTLNQSDTQEDQDNVPSPYMPHPLVGFDHKWWIAASWPTRAAGSLTRSTPKESC